MTTKSVAEIVRVYLSARGVDLPVAACMELSSLVLDAAAIPAYIESETTQPMASATLAHVVALSVAA